MTRAKICGIQTPETLHAAVEAGAAMVGLVHYAPSPRHVSLEDASALRALLPKHVAAVVVLVDAENTLIAETIAQVAPDFIQLHGHETPLRVAEIRARFPQQKLIKAVGVSNAEDVANAFAYVPHVDMVLFDAKPASSNALPGGNNVSFNWRLLEMLRLPVPWLLSGGLNAANVAEAVRISRAQMVDVSSGVESSRGVKDVALIARFLQALASK